MRASTKSIVLAVLITIVNFVTYFTYRMFFFEGVTVIEGIGFTIYESIIHAIVVGSVSYFFFRRAERM